MIKYFIVYFSFSYGINGGIGNVIVPAKKQFNYYWETNDSSGYVYYIAQPTNMDCVSFIKQQMNWRNTIITIDSVKGIETDHVDNATPVGKVTWWTTSEN